MTEFVSAIIGPVIESLMVPIKKHMGYLFLSTDRVRNMTTRMKQLDGTFDDVKNHKDTNDINTLEIPARVPGWLEEVAKIKSDAKTFSSRNDNGCFNIKARYQMGRNAWKTTQEIERLLQEGLALSWTDAQKPLGRVYTRRASTSEPLSGGGIGDEFKSRDTIFKDALKFLQQDQKTQVIALCGMGGVGKTTMMEQLKKVVEDKKMFDWIVKVIIGKQPNWHSIQKAVAENLGKPLTEEIETTRADRLHKRFEETLKKSEKGILVILDDVWEKIELKDVGLSPLPNGVKLLLTSRYEDICKKIAVESNLDLKVLKVNVLEDEEAHKFFCQITKISKESDPELYQIGGDIVKKCSYLPLAIKLIATTLISEERSIWKDSLGRLRNNDLDQNVHEIIKISYDYLKDQEDKEIFLLCGMFLEDSNIPIEDLTRYAWGLKLLNKVSTVGDGRYRIKKCVRNLKNANLLIDSDFPECVKMHDFVLAFVSDTISKGGDHASIINHGNMSKWSSEDMSESCKRISLAYEGMCEFPIGSKCPNLSLLKLMHGDESFKFPQGFFENTEKLKVIAYEKMQYPLLPRSLQCSTNLRMLCLHECSLMFDFSFIGDLSNLEVLNITKCNIRKLPSTIGNLKELKVLDLTDSVDLCIDDGVLKGLVKLEELYMIGPYQQAITFIDANFDELVRCSKNLSTLAIQFNVLPKNISFKKLERFKISVGGNFNIVNDQSRYRFENTLRLVTNKYEILESRMNELFEKTEVLYLQVNGVNDLGGGLAESLDHRPSSFNYLRVLDIYKCTDLRYLFRVGVANGLKKLESLTISNCSILETIVDGDKGGVGVIKFQALKFLSLKSLPNLKSLCNVIDVIELPQLLELKLDGLPKFTSIYPLATSNISGRQSFLNEEVVIPNLEKLHVYNMVNLKEIWPSHFGSNKEVDICMLRVLIVHGCNSLVNLFPNNLMMSLLYHLEELNVSYCGSIEMLFNIDLRYADNFEEARCCLRRIRVSHVENLKEVWRIKGVNDVGITFNGFQAIKSLEIEWCKRFRNIFTPTTINFDMRALKKLIISNCGESGRNNELVTNMQQQQEINVISNEEVSEVDDTISNVAFPTNLIHTFHNLHTLDITKFGGSDVEVVFEILTPNSREYSTTPQKTQQPLLLPYLKDLELSYMEYMSHVWKCNWRKFLIIQKLPKESFSSFHNLTTISLERCKSIKYLFSPLMAKLLSNLKQIHIKFCYAIEEVVSNRDDEEEEEEEGMIASISTSTNYISPNLFPHLDTIHLGHLLKLKCIGGGSGAKGGNKEISSTTLVHDQSKLPQVNDVSWSLCQYARGITIWSCQALPYVIPSYTLGQIQKLEKLTIRSCESLVGVFETQRINVNGNDATMVTRRMNNINVPQLSYLKELDIHNCDLLEHVFTFSTLESLMQLEKLRVINCKAMKVIVKEDNNGEQTKTISSKRVVFPCLKSIELRRLPNLTGFFLGNNEFQWPLLDDVTIDGCPQMMVFTSGVSITPKFNYIQTELGKHSLECGLNFHVMDTLHEKLQIPFSSLDTTNACVTTSKGTPWSFHNLIEMDVKYVDGVKKIIPSNELLQLQKLEKIHVNKCRLVEEVFEASEGIDTNELQSVVLKIPKLREVELESLDNLKYIWKNNPWTILEFPNLTKVSISRCNSLKHVFSRSMVGSLLQLQELRIDYCRKIEVVFKEANIVEEEEERECDAKLANEIIMLPRLKSLKLENLPSLKGFCLGTEAFSWPSLDTLAIKNCRIITFFTKGDSETPELKVVDTSFGRCELVREQDLNSFINTKQQEGLNFG